MLFRDFKNCNFKKVPHWQIDRLVLFLHFSLKGATFDVRTASNVFYELSYVFVFHGKAQVGDEIFVDVNERVGMR